MAVAGKAKKQEEGAPAWMVTYGDMVTLLLTFFVLLLAMSEVKKEDQFIDFMEAIRNAFGYVGGVKQVPMEDIQVPRNVILSKMLIVPINWEDFSKANDPGVRGDERRVQDNRPADTFVVGGRIQFAPLSAALSEAESSRVPQLAREMRGLNTVLKITGHCSQQPVEGTEFADHYDLAYARARTVAEELILNGIEARRIIIEVAGTNRPVTEQAYTEHERKQNELVEIVQLEERVTNAGP